MKFHGLVLHVHCSCTYEYQFIYSKPTSSTYSFNQSIVRIMLHCLKNRVRIEALHLISTSRRCLVESVVMDIEPVLLTRHCNYHSAYISVQRYFFALRFWQKKRIYPVLENFSIYKCVCIQFSLYTFTRYICMYSLSGFVCVPD